MTALKIQTAQKRERVAPIKLLPPSDPVWTLADELSEEAVIGSVLQKPSLFAELSEILQPADFFFIKNGYIWHTCELLANAGEGIDLITIANKMDELKAPLQGEQLIHELARMIEGAPDFSNAKQYAKAVFETALRLRLLDSVNGIKKLAENKTMTIDEVIDQSDHLLYKATNRHAETRTDAFSIMNNYFTRVENMLNDGENPAVMTGFTQIDVECGGIYPGEVTVLAGSEGMGKTTCALSITRNMVKAGYRVAVFTLEMSQEEIIRTFTSMESGIYKSVLKSFGLSGYQWGLFVQSSGDIAKWPLEIVDEYPTLTPGQCRRKLRKLMNDGAIDAVVIDGLWLMEANEPCGERHRDVGVIMRDLNLVARDFNVPILITHQYNAQIDGKKHPTVYYLSESAGVRRNAQMIWGLHRPSFYDRDSLDNVTSLYSLKDRNGGSAGTKWALVYNTQYSRYEGANYVTIAGSENPGHENRD